ncbi:MAG: cysteine--tRNA ligase [bacterium]
MARPISLYNTMSRSVEPLVPLTGDRVAIYTCGPTVYNNQHVGNYRTYIYEDVLVKTLRFFGYEVDRVMNITDVGHLTSDEDEGEDKMEVGARREGLTAWDVAKRYEGIFLADLDQLHIERPTRLIRATDTITQQVAFIKGLEEKGLTYTIEDGVYFDSSKVSDYGRLARLDLEGLQAGARVEMAEGKRRVTDFALWKFSRPPGKRDMEWESPWGTGFPGWHIECSAIIRDQLGDEIDIHCGGTDHIPVHHVNEIAQSESLTGKPLAKEWLHTDFLLVDGGKMSKSLGNFYTVADLVERKIDPLAFRIFTYSAGYRSKLNFTWEAIEAAQKSLERLRRLTADLPEKGATGPDVESLIERGSAALADDLNTSQLMAVIWEAFQSDLEPAGKRMVVESFEPILSLGLGGTYEAPSMTVPENVRELAQQRDVARTAREWEVADQLRLEIEKAGYAVRDSEGVGQVYPL